MINYNNIYLPKSISNTAITAYIVALIVVSVLFNKYTIEWYFMLFGIIEVVGFYYFGNSLGKQYVFLSEKLFKRKIFKVSLVIRVAYVCFSYFFYLRMTGAPFEFGAADSKFYHDTADYMATMFYDGNYEFYKLFSTIDFSDAGYCVYLGIVYIITDHSIFIARIIKAMLSALICVYVYDISKRNFGYEVARLAAVFTMLCPNLIYYCGIHVKEIEMTFFTLFTINKFDELFHNGKFNFYRLILPIVSLFILFSFRTVLGLSVVFSVATTILLSNNKVISFSKKILTSVVLVLVFAFFMWEKIGSQVVSTWENRDQQQANMEWRSRRKNGNEFAKYAGAAVFAPLIFSIPFPTMVSIDSQEHQIMSNGSNFAKNCFSFFTIYSLFILIVRRKWKNHVLIIGYMVSYVGILALSEFAQSERFHMPVLPVELILVAFGVSISSFKINRMFNCWCVGMVFVAIAWNWFKLAGRGMI